MDEDRAVLMSFPPERRRELAGETGALKGLRKDKSVEPLLRVLPLHVGCGHSLRGSVVRARMAGLADVSAIALMKRPRKSKDRLHAPCVELFREQGVAVACDGGFRVRVFDATTVGEPGRTGSLRRLHYSVRFPSPTCDFFRLTATKGHGVGGSLLHFPIRAGDHVLADRGYSTAGGIRHVAAAGGHVTVRVNTGSQVLRTTDGAPFDLPAAVTSLERAGAVGSRPVVAVEGTVAAPGRVCAIRKTQQAGRVAGRKLPEEAARKGRRVQPRTLEFAHHVIVFTTFPEPAFTASEVLQWYRTRWRVEPVFRRFRSPAQLGHLPEYDDESAKVWLYGKLLVALLVEKPARHAVAVSPPGIPLGDGEGRPIRGVTSGSFSTKSRGPSNRTCL